MRRNYVLIDFENVVPEHIELLDREWVKVLMFVGKSQTKIPTSIASSIQKLGSRAKYVVMSGTGHNALDFHIAYYIGCISAQEKDAYFHIVSNDQGFDPLIAHLKTQGIFSDRVARIEDIPALRMAEGLSMSPNERVALAKERLLKSGVTHPRTRKTLTSHIAAMFQKTLSEDQIEAIVTALFKDGCVHESGTKLKYQGEE